MVKHEFSTVKNTVQAQGSILIAFIHFQYSGKLRRSIRRRIDYCEMSSQIKLREGESNE